jgi:hypothetical protein
MVQIFGEFQNESVKSREFLMLGFSPGSTPPPAALAKQWLIGGFFS